MADSSVGVSWAVKGQSSSATDELRERVLSVDAFVVPALWMLEVANALLVLMRRRKIEPEDHADARFWLSRLKPLIDEEASLLAFGRITELAGEHSLTVYDAIYLELALRRSLPLASRDASLNKAARRCGVQTLL